MANENNWGGLRKGSGRKNSNKSKVLYVRISEEALAKLDSVTKNRSQYIDDLILSI